VAVGLVLILMAAVGCGGGSPAGRAKVTGRVKCFDKNLTCGTVIFHSKDGKKTGSGNIDFDGNYEVTDAPLGDCTITVSVPQSARGPMGTAQPKPPPGVPEMRPPGSSGGSAVPPIDPTKIVPIPVKYESPETSGLKYTVERGSQTHNITLNPA
jgi:hypothetical protein